MQVGNDSGEQLGCVLEAGALHNVKPGGDVDLKQEVHQLHQVFILFWIESAEEESHDPIGKGKPRGMMYAARADNKEVGVLAVEVRGPNSGSLGKMVEHLLVMAEIVGSL